MQYPYPINTNDTTAGGMATNSNSNSVAIPSMVGGGLIQSPSSLFPPLSSSLHSTSAAIPMPHGSSHMLGTSASSSFLSGSMPQSASQSQEEITTIFVVGFPDDMSEREFQSMFTFSSGFEAAALKIPQLGDTDDPLSKKQIIGFAKFRTRAEALEAVQILAGRKVDAERGCVLKAEMAKKNLHTKKASVVIPNGSVSSDYQSQFLKNASASSNTLFRRSRLPMNDLMQYVDPALFSQNDPITSASGNPANSVLGSSVASTVSQLDYYYHDLGRQASIDLGSSVLPGVAASAAEENSTPGFRMSSDAGSDDSPVTGTAETPDSLQEVSEVAGAGRSTITSAAQPVPIQTSHVSTHHPKNTMTPPEAIRTTFSLDSDPYYPNSAKSPLTASSGNNSFLQNSHGLFSSSERGFHSALFNSESLLSSSSRATHSSSSAHGAGGLVSAASSGTHIMSSSFSGSSPALQHQQLTQGSIPISMNSRNSLASRVSPPQMYSGSLDRHGSFSSGSLPTSLPFTGNDQNPPCNTLYVGNLPPDANEDELRMLFSACPGYKRMSFKNRGNGPMCFVEFESIYFATQALVQLYGNHLSNSTKGGIRLSYSKNPLGVRQQPSTSQQQQSLGTSSPASNSSFMNQATTSAVMSSYSSNSSSFFGYYNSASNNNHMPHRHSISERGSALSNYSTLSSSLTDIYPSNQHVQSHHLSLGRHSATHSPSSVGGMSGSANVLPPSSSEAALRNNSGFLSPLTLSLLSNEPDSLTQQRLVQQS